MRKRNWQCANSWIAEESELCLRGCSISRCDRCRHILPHLVISLRWTISPRPRGSIRMEYVMWLRLRLLKDTSGSPMRKTRAFRSCMRARLDTTELCVSWKNPDPIRRHYYDSGANEGIGFYSEELMLQSGLYDDSPHTREIVYNQMRLRALRVIADVKLALGTFTPEEAVDFMQHNVPMSQEDARAEVVEMDETPGQKISYQIGKFCRSRRCCRRRETNEVRSSACEISTTTCGGTGMYPLRCKGGNFWGWMMRCANSTVRFTIDIPEVCGTERRAALRCFSTGLLHPQAWIGWELKPQFGNQTLLT